VQLVPVDVHGERYRAAPTRPAVSAARYSEPFPTALGVSTTDRISLLGQDLADDIMGTVGFGELAFWLAARRRPTPGETRLFEAVLAGLADHGFTPTAIAARLTYLSAPESVQGALAAGVLGAGSRFLGVTEDSARFLSAALRAGEPTDDAGWDRLARETVQAERDRSRLIPGLGHHIHRDGDPRARRLYAIAEEESIVGPHLRLLQSIGAMHPEIPRPDVAAQRGRCLRRRARGPPSPRGVATGVLGARPHGGADRPARRGAGVAVGRSLYHALDVNSYARPLTEPAAHEP
jgi:hypothetical protein